MIKGLPASVSKSLRDAILAEIAKGESLRSIARRADVAHTIVAKFAKGGDIRLSSAEALAIAVCQPLRM